MRPYMWAFVLMLSAVPSFAQEEDDVLFQLRMGAAFAEGNLALRDLQAENHPVQQMKRFLRQAKLSLTSTQERQLNTIVEDQIKAIQASPQNEEAIRKVNQEHTAKFYGILTPDQRTAMRRYRADQIMMYGGFPALKLVLENAQTPLTAEQETQVRSLYDEFHQQFRQMPRDSRGAADRVQLDKVENTALARVIRLLTPAQRRALADSRQGSLNQRSR